MTLPELPLSALEKVLTGPHGMDVVQLVAATIFNTRRDTTPAAEVMAAAEAAGLFAQGSPTPVAEEVAHPFRELLLWEERQRQLPRFDPIPTFDASSFVAQDVLEVGSGFGVNLLSLQPHAARAVGVEINPAFVDISPVLAAAVQMPAPEVHLGRGEALPFDDDSFDTVLCIGALQYMDIAAALAEMKRVARPGGQIINVLGHLSGYLRDAALRHGRRRRFRPLLVEAREIVTMLTYPSIGRALGHAHSPVYPPRRQMARLAEQAGLHVERTEKFKREAVYVMRA